MMAGNYILTSAGGLTVALDRPTPVSQSLFQQTYGGSLASCQIMLVFYGISVLQTYLYFLRYEKDHPLLKLLVLALFILSTIHAAFVCHTVWHYLIFSYTDVDLLLDGEWSVYVATAVGVCACFLVQSFFARTIYTLLRGKWRMLVTTITVTLFLAQLGFGVALAVKLFQIWDLYLLKEAVDSTMIPMFCSRMASDAVFTITLCVVLYDTSTDSNYSSGSVRLVKLLIVYAINRFVLTTIVVAVQTIVLIIRPNEIWAMVLEFITVHIYVNSLLATLNTRDHLRDVRNDGQSMDASRLPVGQSALVFRSERCSGFAGTLDNSSGATAIERVHVHLQVRSLDHSGGRRQSFELSDMDRKPVNAEAADASGSNRMV